MGYGTLNNVPRLRTYSEALNRYNSTKPIRGTDERRLGARRHKHLRIEKGERGEIRCILYQTPVVTFYPDDNIDIKTDGWSTSFTCAFISEILLGVTANHVRRRMVVYVTGGGEFTLEKDQVLTLRPQRDENGHFAGLYSVVNAQGPWVWAINKAKANNVRAPFNAFLKFYRGLIALTAQKMDPGVDRFGGIKELGDFQTKNQVAFATSLIAETIGTEEVEIAGRSYNFVSGTFMSTVTTDKRIVLDTTGWGAIRNKPLYKGSDDADSQSRVRKLRMEFNESKAYFCSLMASEDTADHLKAAMILVAAELNISWVGGAGFTPPSEHIMSKSSALDLPNKMILKLFAEEILEYVQMPVGTVPSTDYGRNLFQEFREKTEAVAKGQVQKA